MGGMQKARQPNETADVHVGFRTDAPTKQAMHAAADAAGVTLSYWCAATLAEAAKRFR